MGDLTLVDSQGFLGFLSWHSCSVSVAARLSGASVLYVPTTSMGWPTLAI